LAPWGSLVLTHFVESEWTYDGHGNWQTMTSETPRNGDVLYGETVCMGSATPERIADFSVPWFQGAEECLDMAVPSPTDPAVDNDGDGWTESSGDCNDADPEIHPLDDTVVDSLFHEGPYCTPEGPDRFSYDYDCSGDVEFEVTEVTIDDVCTDDHHPTTIGGWWMEVPDCGEEGTWLDGCSSYIELGSRCWEDCPGSYWEYTRYTEALSKRVQACR
jgi:hypothetical protein